MTCDERECLCNRLVEMAMANELTPEQEKAANRLFNKWQLINSAGKETPNFEQRFISATRRVEPKPRKAKRVRRTTWTPNRLATM